MTPEDEEMIKSLVERVRQGDTYGYFELLELYPQAKFRKQIRTIINDHLSAEERRRLVDWEELKAKDPARYVRLSLMNLGIRSYTHGRDLRDDWMGIELTAMYARDHHVNAGPILDEIAELSPFMHADLRKHWDIYYPC